MNAGTEKRGIEHYVLYQLLSQIWELLDDLEHPAAHADDGRGAQQVRVPRPGGRRDLNFRVQHEQHDGEREVGGHAVGHGEQAVERRDGALPVRVVGQCLHRRRAVVHDADLSAAEPYPRVLGDHGNQRVPEHERELWQRVQRQRDPRDQGLVRDGVRGDELVV